MPGPVRSVGQHLRSLTRSLHTAKTARPVPRSIRRIQSKPNPALPATLQQDTADDKGIKPASKRRKEKGQIEQEHLPTAANPHTKISNFGNEPPSTTKMNFGRTHPTRPNPEAPWEWSRPQHGMNTVHHTHVPNSTIAAAPKKSKEERDLRTPPSAASGGIPNPTPAYLQLAALPPLSLSEPRKLLVVIDLNGTLLHRPNRKQPGKFIERPHARQFLAYCIDVFNVVIWSSAKQANVASMCNQLLTPIQRKKVLAIWAREKFGLTPADFLARTQCYKRLHVLWADPIVAASHPDAASRGVRWSQQDTVLIDDSMEKARSEPHNLIEIPEFSSENAEVADILPQVHDYINECASQANVSSFIREKPFQAHSTSQLQLGIVQQLQG